MTKNISVIHRYHVLLILPALLPFRQGEKRGGAVKIASIGTPQQGSMRS